MQDPIVEQMEESDGEFEQGRVVDNEPLADPSKMVATGASEDGTGRYLI